MTEPNRALGPSFAEPSRSDRNQSVDGEIGDYKPMDLPQEIA
jgi:hypothetical protein